MSRTTIWAVAALMACAAGTAAAQEETGQLSVAENFPSDRGDPLIPSGIDIPVTLDEDIPIERDRMGDTFEGHISRDVEVGGETALVGGAPVEVKLVEGPDGRTAMLRLTKVHVNGDMVNVRTAPAEADTEERGLSTAQKTGAGAVAGAIVGAVTGAGVLEGAVVGAGGGLAWGLLDGDQARKVDDDTPLRFSLQEDVELD